MMIKMAVECFRILSGLKVSLVFFIFDFVDRLDLGNWFLFLLVRGR
jgi:hypothetical protein